MPVPLLAKKGGVGKCLCVMATGRLHTPSVCSLDLVLRKIFCQMCVHLHQSQVRLSNTLNPSLNEPQLVGKAFCADHARLLQDHKYPTALREFIKFCGCNPNQYTKLVRVNHFFRQCRHFVYDMTLHTTPHPTQLQLS